MGPVTIDFLHVRRAYANESLILIRFDQRCRIIDRLRWKLISRTAFA